MENPQSPANPPLAETRLLSMAAIRAIWAARRAGKVEPILPVPRTARVRTADAQPRERRGKKFDGEQLQAKRSPKPTLGDEPLVRARYLERNDTADDRISYWSPSPLARHMTYVRAVQAAQKHGDYVRSLARVGSFTPNKTLTIAFLRQAAKSMHIGIEEFPAFAESYVGMQS